MTSDLFHDDINHPKAYPDAQHTRERLLYEGNLICGRLFHM